MRLPAKTPHLMSLLNFSQCDHPIHQILWFWLCIHIKLNFLPEINFPTKKFHVLEHLRQCDTSNYKPYGGSRLVLLLAIYICLNKRVHQNRHEWSLFNIKRLIKPTTKPRIYGWSVFNNPPSSIKTHWLTLQVPNFTEKTFSLMKGRNDSF